MLLAPNLKWEGEIRRLVRRDKGHRAKCLLWRGRKEKFYIGPILTSIGIHKNKSFQSMSYKDLSLANEFKST